MWVKIESTSWQSRSLFFGCRLVDSISSTHRLPNNAVGSIISFWKFFYFFFLIYTTRKPISRVIKNCGIGGLIEVLFGYDSFYLYKEKDQADLPYILNNVSKLTRDFSSKHAIFSEYSTWFWLSFLKTANSKIRRSLPSCKKC